MVERVDCVVIGAGVVGLAVARSLALRNREVLVLEDTPRIGSGISSRNSEVIHAGIYYPPGSLKAQLCREGRDKLYAYCEQRGVPHSRCGKIVVACSLEQEAELERIRARAEANNVTDLCSMELTELRELEPDIHATKALFSPATGIVDIHALMLSFRGDIENSEGTVICRSPVVDGYAGDGGVFLQVAGEQPCAIHARSVVNSAGLSAPALARCIGVAADCIPTQHLSIGHYYALTGKSPFRHLIYPATNQFGGLGVHVTLDLAGQARFGPDARWIDATNYTFDDSQFEAFADAIRLYYPALEATMLAQGYTGIRPKLSGRGDPFADFRIDGPSHHRMRGLINLFGIESPGLTASLAIADYVSDLIENES
jgi:L-2-hydroxyglutarate oxidase LhgO